MKVLSFAPSSGPRGFGKEEKRCQRWPSTKIHLDGSQYLLTPGQVFPTVWLDFRSRAKVLDTFFVWFKTKIEIETLGTKSHDYIPCRNLNTLYLLKVPTYARVRSFSLAYSRKNNHILLRLLFVHFPVKFVPRRVLTQKWTQNETNIKQKVGTWETNCKHFNFKLHFIGCQFQTIRSYWISADFSLHCVLRI